MDKGSTLSSWHGYVRRIFKRCFHFLQPSPTRHIKEKSMTKKSSGRLWATAFVALAAIGLTACGGGGGGGAVTPVAAVDSTPPTFSLTTATPAALASAVVVTASENLLAAGATITVADAGVTKSGGTVLGADQKTLTWSSSSGDFLCGKTYTVTASASDVAGNAGTMPATTFTTIACPAAAYWNPAPAFAPMGTRVTGANQLPAGCTATTQQCWKDAVINGTVKFIATSATMTGVNARPIVFAYYRGATGLYNMQPFYADTGDVVTGNLTGGVASEPQWGIGNAAGMIIRELSSGNCFQWKWYPAGDPSGRNDVWATEPAACPA